MRPGSVRMAGLLAAGLVALVGCSSSSETAGSDPPVTRSAGAAVVAPVHRFGPADFEARSVDRVLINVHIPDEGSLPGTDLALPYDQVGARATELPSDTSTPLAIYCMTDHMSGIAGQELVALGYTDIIELDGGMQAWRASGRTLLPAAS